MRRVILGVKAIYPCCHTNSILSYTHKPSVPKSSIHVMIAYTLRQPVHCRTCDQVSYGNETVIPFQERPLLVRIACWAVTTHAPLNLSRTPSPRTDSKHYCKSSGECFLPTKRPAKTQTPSLMTMCHICELMLLPNYEIATACISPLYHGTHCVPICR